MIPRLKPALGARELAAALSRPHDDDVVAFERAFAAQMGQAHAVAFGYGRTALLATIDALGIRGRDIICPAYTCVVVAHAIVKSGNRPVFIDCAPGSFSMDLDAAERAIGPDTGAIIATSLFGFPVDLDRLDALRARHPEVSVIQDCAHSFAAEWRGRPVQQAGHAAIFGLNISKLFTSLFGGMATTDDAALAARLRAYRQREVRPRGVSKSLRRLAYLMAVYPAFWPPVYGAVHELIQRGWLDAFVKYYDEAVIDLPRDHLDAMTSLEARVGLAQTARYRDIVEARRARARAWREHLQGLPGIELPPDVPGATWSHFVALVDDRDRWVAQWRARGVELGVLIEYCIPEMAAYRPLVPSEARFPVSSHYAQHTVNFPLGGLPEVAPAAARFAR